MRYNILQPVKEYDGSEAKDSDGKPITFKTVFTTALNATLRDEVLEAEKKAKCYLLTNRLYLPHPEKTVLSVDECAFIKERVGKVYPPLVYGRAVDFFEQAGKPEPEQAPEDADGSEDTEVTTEGAARAQRRRKK